MKSARVLPPRPSLSIVIPAFNEERRIGPSLERLVGYARSRRLACELVVVDDGSTDATAKIASGLGRRLGGLRLLRLERNQGKGAAIRAGVLAARGKRVLFTDADLSTPPEDLPILERALDSGADLVVGSRALDRSRIAVHQPLYREVAGRLFNVVVRCFSVPGIHDTQCGFKLFRTEVGRRLLQLQQIPRFGFDVEFLFLARKAGYRVEEVSVRWTNSPETTVRPLRDGARAFLDIALIRLYAAQGRYRPLID
ncbi:MAG: dolichyl-phosphate beta-glucosyltransferase [bacterium]